MKIKFFFLAALFVLPFVVFSAQTEKIKIEKIDKQKLSSLLKNRKGNALFINLWATWCIPCREEFPSIVKLVNDYKNKPVDFIGISIDYPDEIDSKIIPFLEKQNANFANFVNGFEKDEDLIKLLDENWNGALPATFTFDKTGKKISFLEGEQSYNSFKKEIKKVIKR